MKELFRAAIAITALFIPLATARADNVEWKPVLTTDNALFPSLILATRNLDSKSITNTPPPPNYLGDPMGLFGIALTTTHDNEKIKVSVAIDGLSKSSEFEGTLPTAGQEYTVIPYIRYKTNALEKVSQPYPTTAVFSVSIDNAPAQQVVENINVRAVNDVPYSISAGGKQIDTTLLFSAYVNEDAPVVDAILRDALAHNAVSDFVGYSGSQQDVYRQIFAIWNSLQRSGIKYSNIAAPSGYSKDVQSQHVRLVGESLEYSQANCVDGSVLLASALYKIGMCPMLILKPGHMFLGVYANQASCDRKDLRSLIFIETTEVGQIPPLTSWQKEWHFQTNTGYLASASYQSLLHAIAVGRQEFNAIVPALQANQAGYHMYDIRQLRSMGITPISSSSTVAR